MQQTKHYIILSRHIHSICGSLIYQYNKLNYYKRKGYKVNLFHQHYDKELGIYIEAFKQYEKDCLIPKFEFPPYFFSNKIRLKIVNKILKYIGYKSGNYVLIESDDYTLGLWGELLAKECYGKHISFPLAENVYIKNKNHFFFYKYKLDRGELFRISKKAMQNMFKGWIDIPLDKCLALQANSYNALDNIDYLSNHKIIRGDYVIGSVGRLGKNFLYHNLLKIKDFTNKYPNNTYTILIIGGGPKEIYNKIVDLFNDSSNVYLYITGNIYPIPVELARFADVYFSSAGSCRITAKLGKLTISCDGNDLEPIGIINYTTNNSLYRTNNEPPIDIRILLKGILFDKKYKENLVEFDAEKENNIDYKEHEESISKSAKSKEYFDISQLKLSTKEKIIKSIIYTFGLSGYKRLINMKAKLLGSDKTFKS